MTTESVSASAPVALLCGDAAITPAGELLAPRAAVLVTVREPVGSGTVGSTDDRVRSAPLGRLVASATDLDAIAADVAADKARLGVEIIGAAGVDATPRMAQGKDWEAICALAESNTMRVCDTPSPAVGSSRITSTPCREDRAGHAHRLALTAGQCTFR